MNETPSSPGRIARTLWWLAFAYVTVTMLCVGVDAAFHFIGSPIDGPFQLFNALRRIAAGQHIGTGFQFFHGPGLPYLHYPLFRLLGSTFVSSELARQIISLGAFIAGTWVVLWAFSRDALAAAQLTILVVIATIVLRIDAVYLPINSMIGVRSTMPLLVAAILVWPAERWRHTVVTGIAVGIALLFATEQGLATVVGLVLSAVIVAWLDRAQRSRLVDTCVSLCVAVATYCVILFCLAGPSGFGAAVRYNFGAVPKDQFWYFGGPPNRFWFEWSQPFRLGLMPLLIGIIGVGLIATIAGAWLNRPSRRASSLTPAIAAELFLALYAFFSTIPIFGTLVAVYLEPGVRVMLILGALAIWRLGGVRTVAGSVVAQIVERRMELAALALVIAGWMTRATVMRVTVFAPAHMARVHIGMGAPPMMSNDWDSVRAIGKRMVAATPAVAQHRAPVIWSTYAGVVESDAGVFNPDVDYVIHALGPGARAVYTRRFIASHADLVQTIRPDYAMYEEWVEDNTWEFYRYLLSHYAIATETPWSEFWMPRALPFNDGAEVVASGALGPDQHGIALKIDALPDSVSLFEFRLRYHVNNALGKVPFVGGLPRYVITIEGTANKNSLSLAPYDSVRRFPIVTVGATTIKLDFGVASLVPGASFVVDSVQVTQLRVAPENAPWLAHFANPKRPGPSG